MRRSLSSVFFGVALTASLPAWAQDPNCPPGAWFCEDAGVEAPPTAAPAAPPGAEKPADAGKNTKPPPANNPRGGQTVVHPAARPRRAAGRRLPAGPERAAAAGDHRRPGGASGAAPSTRCRRRRRDARAWRPEWGLNLRLEGAMFGPRGRRTADAGMGGLGMSLRYRPVPAFAIDAGIDLLGGTDYNGFERAELPLSLSGLLYVNPRSRCSSTSWAASTSRTRRSAPTATARSSRATRRTRPSASTSRSTATSAARAASGSSSGSRAAWR